MKCGRPLALALLSVVALTCHHPNHAPNPPGIPAGPSNGYAQIQYTYSVQAADPDGDSVRYQFDFGTGDTMGWSRLVPSATVCSASTMWNADGNYAVRARAEDRHFAVSDWSGVMSVGIGNSAPSTPEFVYAPDTAWAGTLDTIRVSSIDPDNDPVRFVVDWDDSAALDTYAFAPSCSYGTFGRHWLYPGSYPVRALALDSHGRPSEWSAPHVITVPGPPLRWRYQAGPEVSDALALGPDGTVYFATGNLLQALNPDGTPKWQYPLHNTRPTPVSVSPKNTVYVRVSVNDLSALSEAGVLNWSMTFLHHGTSSQIMASALGLNGVVYHRADSMYALDAGGTMLWRSGRGRTHMGPPAIGADGTIYFSSQGRDSVYALNPDGTRRWAAYYADAWYYAPPAIGLNGAVYVCGAGSELAAFSADGAQLWTCTVQGSHKSFPPAVGPDGTIYCGGAAGLTAVNPDGTVRWLYATRGAVEGTPAITADSSIIFGSDDNLLYAVGPDGRIRWARGTRGEVRSSPVIGPDGTVYFGSNDGYVYAVAGTSPLANSPWPMFGHDPQHTGRAVQP